MLGEGGLFDRQPDYCVEPNVRAGLGIDGGQFDIWMLVRVKLVRAEIGPGIDRGRLIDRDSVSRAGIMYHVVRGGRVGGLVLDKGTPGHDMVATTLLKLREPFCNRRIRLIRRDTDNPHRQATSPTGDRFPARATFMPGKVARCDDDGIRWQVAWRGHVRPEPDIEHAGRMMNPRIFSGGTTPAVRIGVTSQELNLEMQVRARRTTG